MNQRLSSACPSRRIRMGLRQAVWLAPWVAASVILGLALSRTDLSATAGLFQSELPTEQATATQSVSTATAPVPEPTTAAPATPALEPTAAVPTEVPSAAPTPEASPALPPASPLPRAPSPTAQLRAEERYPSEEAGLRYDWRMLFDTLALGVSYVWLACGVALLVIAVPLVTWLWLRGRRRR